MFTRTTRSPHDVNALGEDEQLIWVEEIQNLSIGEDSMSHWFDQAQLALDEISSRLRHYDDLPDTPYAMEMTGFVPRQIRAMLAHS